MHALLLGLFLTLTGTPAQADSRQCSFDVKIHGGGTCSYRQVGETCFGYRSPGYPGYGTCEVNRRDRTGNIYCGCVFTR
jgi:hypothetical protein